MRGKRSLYRQSETFKSGNIDFLLAWIWCLLVIAANIMYLIDYRRGADLLIALFTPTPPSLVSVRQQHTKYKVQILHTNQEFLPGSINSIEG